LIAYMLDIAANDRSVGLAPAMLSLESLEK
jgi:hypothetical protein